MLLIFNSYTKKPIIGSDISHSYPFPDMAGNANPMMGSLRIT